MKDVTEQVQLGNVHGDTVTVLKCVCGHVFEPYHFMITTDLRNGDTCPNCKHKFYFEHTVKVVEID